MRKIRLLAILVCFCFFINLMPINAFTNGFTSEEAFFNYVKSEYGGQYKTPSGKIASYETYKKYGLIVFGSPWGDTKSTGINGYTGTQYRHLGFKIDDESYFNPNFPPDVIGSNYDKPESWNYITVPNATNSWTDINTDQKTHMKVKPLSGNGANSSTFTVNSIGGENYAKVLSPSTWKSQGSVYTINKGNDGKLYYATFITPPMVGDTLVTGNLTTTSNTYYIRSDQDSVDIPVVITANASLTGYANATHVKTLSASFKSQNVSKSQVSSVTNNATFIANRSNYSVGTHQIPLDGTVSILSIFDDADSRSVSKTITLIVEEKGNAPYVEASATPVPSQVQFNNNDIAVKVTVKGILKNYTNTANIKEWVFYARQKEDATAIIKKEYVKTLTSQTDFSFTIPKSKITGDNFTQQYVLRARCYFNQAVNGQDFYDAPVETSTYVYKTTSPTPVITPNPMPSNNPPVAVLNAPSTARAGEDVYVSGGGSYDTDGTIQNYFYTSINATGSVSGVGSTIWYPIDKLGLNILTLAVSDDRGATDATSRNITITDPKPYANLKVTGTLKENRKIIIDATATNSPSHYPLDMTKTYLSITPISGGTVTDIKYTGSLVGFLSKDIIIKKAGQYKVTVYAENTLGYSDSKDYVITVQPDQVPVAEYAMFTKIYRDRYDSNFAKNVISVMCYSPDQDIIKEKTWTITYNADNSKLANDDSDFSNDTSFSFKDSDLILDVEKIISHGGYDYKIKKIGFDKIELKCNQVGEYRVELSIVEDFGQPTILSFINPSDYRTGNTNNLHAIEKTFKIDNKAPTVDFAP